MDQRIRGLGYEVRSLSVKWIVQNEEIKRVVEKGKNGRKEIEIKVQSIQNLLEFKFFGGRDMVCFIFCEVIYIYCRD